MLIETKKLIVETFNKIAADNKFSNNPVCKLDNDEIIILQSSFFNCGKFENVKSLSNDHLIMLCSILIFGLQVEIKAYRDDHLICDDARRKIEDLRLIKYNVW